MFNLLKTTGLFLALSSSTCFIQAQTLHHFGWFGHQVLNYEVKAGQTCGATFKITYAETNIENYSSAFCSQNDDGMLLIFEQEDGTQLAGTLSILPEVASFGNAYYGQAYVGRKEDCEIKFAMAGGYSTLEVLWPSKDWTSPVGFALTEEQGPDFEALEALLRDKENYRGSGQVKARFTLQNFHLEDSDAVFLEVNWVSLGSQNMLDLRFTGAFKAQIKVPVSLLLD